MLFLALHPKLHCIDKSINMNPIITFYITDMNHLRRCLGIDALIEESFAAIVQDHLHTVEEKMKETLK